MRRTSLLALATLFVLLAASLEAQPLLKSAINVDAGNKKQVGQTFTYRLTYNCSSTSGPCLNAEVDDLLPAVVQFVDTVPSSPAGDVAAVNVTNNFMGSGRTRVQFVMNTPLTAGNSGDLLVDVKFPDGSTPDGTVATNTADGINLGATPGTFTTPPVSVTAVAAFSASMQKTLQTSPANLDMPETYRLRINNNGSLNLTAIGPVTDTLPPGTVFNSSSPAADCEPGCDATTPATVTWTSPCSTPLAPGSNCDISVNVTFPSATFTSGTNVTNSFTGTGTPLGQPSTTLGTGTITHPVTTFVPAPSVNLSKSVDGNSPNPPTLNQTFTYDLSPSNNGNVPLDNMVLIDTLPIQLKLSSVTTGAYNNTSDFAAGVGVQVTYEKNTAPGVFTLWGSSPNATTNTTLTAPPPGLGAGEFITHVEWQFGQAQVGMSASTRPQLTGQIVNPDNNGNPVAVGNTIQNCANITATFTAGPTNVSKLNVCNTFTLSGPFVQLNPAKDNLSGGGPFNPGQMVNWRLRVRSDARSSDPVPLEDLVAADLLPVDLIFVSWSFDDQGTGLPAPQNFEQIPNFAGTGRTLLRWHWNAGSGNLGVNQQVWILPATTIRVGAVGGALSNTFDLTSNAPPATLGQRCSGSSITDSQDLDNDGSTTDTLCTASGSANVTSIAQLVSAKTIQGTCDGSPSASSAGTLLGGAIQYHLSVTNPGTVPMENFVLIDILPFVGDTGVRDTSPRGSQWTPLLAAPIAPPPGTVISYSTSGNPCRGEVGGPTTGCDPPNWTTVAPVPITSVRSFKVEFGSRVVNPADGVSFTYSMVTGGNVAPGLTAFNSFAYQADRSDGVGSLAAEPQKVGIALGACTGASLGDFVWVDTNKDGLQNDGPTGLDNVTVQLFQPGPDGLANTPDDVLLASSITGPSPTNTAGWYNFPGLAPGNYFVKVFPPPTFTMTTQHVGADSTIDSDGNPATFNSQIVALASGDANETIDFGLVTSHFAALGDYVWFDRNSNGIQDESPDDGANGVSVQLFVDNGDGVAGGGDAMVATTLTANDQFGRPGYYLFDQLIPGLPYYVKFIKPAAATAFTSRHTGADTTVDSDAVLADGTTQIVVLAPDQVNLTIDAGLIAPSGVLALGDQVWLDTNNNGIFEPEDGEPGIDGVVLDLYNDVNNDGLPTVDEYSGRTTTQTLAGFDGLYRFNNLAPGNYIVVVDPVNFLGGHPLSGLSTSTGNDPAPDPDDDVNGDDNGTNLGALIGSLPVTLTTGGEPTSEDGDPNTNLTVDFGFFTNPNPATVLFFDYGDAPDTGAGTGRGNYNTTALDNGPSHLLGVANAPYLGLCVDSDDGFQQNATATADDIAGPTGLAIGNCASGNDEDGVTFAGPFTPGQSATFSVTAAAGTNNGKLDAWVDWNQDGVFGDSPGEQIATDVVISSGTTVFLTPTVPANAVPGETYARFRFSSAGGLGPTGSAPDGEVEDYMVGIVGFDFGDAPASYGTAGAGAAVHKVSPPNPLRLGQCIDTELDGQPSVNADGDDTNIGTAQYGNCLNDEDGVTFTSSIVACGTTSVSVTANAIGKLDAWLDFDRNGTFDPADEIFNDVVLAAGVNTLTFNVPCTAAAGLTYARFRLSSAGGLGPTGPANDGEVEDYAVTTSNLDFGDAPDTYHTLLASNGARHVIVPGFSLGATVDSEPNGQPTVGATGDGADEDGVALPVGPLVACSTITLGVTLTNTAAIAAPKLDGWIDFDGDGHFDDPRDRVFTSTPLVAGLNNLMVTIPCDAPTTPAGQLTYARFRLSSTGVAGPTGLANDGEVEDYAMTILALDFGDAPDTYHTLLASNGPRHTIVSGFSLGPTIDAEADGQPNAAANGDGADEDGVTLPNGGVLQTCTTQTFTVNLTNTAGAATPKLDAWIDFDGDGHFDDPRDRISTSRALVPGANSFTVAIPCDATTHATTYARFRLSSAGGLAPTGAAANGEVEDYLVTVDALDFGDAPDSYHTLLASNGPSHVIIPGFSLGATEDAEADGAPSPNADGDGADEDGVTFPTGPDGNTIKSCVANTLTVVLTNTAAIGAPKLDAWIDFDGDGAFDNPRDHFVVAQALVSGSNSITFTAPCDPAKSSKSYARFRLSSAGISTPTGPAADGEVEDYVVNVVGLDYGDAPDPTFPTLLASNGARHRVLVSNNPSFGATPPDIEPDGQPSANADGDDTHGVDDEDGVTFPLPLVAGATGHITLHTGPVGGTVNCWVDINQNGSWADSGEHVVTDTLMAANTNTTFAFPVPLGTPAPGNAVTRCRISSMTGLSFTGEAPDGEVEDDVVPVVIDDPSIGVGECVVSLTPDFPNDQFVLVLNVRLENFGNVPLTALQAVTPLASVFAPPAHYEIVSVSSPDFTINPSYDGNGDSNLLAAGNVLAVGETGNIRIVLHLTNNHQPGMFSSSTTAQGTSPIGTVVTDMSENGCNPDPANTGDPTTQNLPTPINLILLVPIPTLSLAGLAALLALLAMVAVRRLGN